MFSGIVEETAQVVAIEHDKDNIHITMKCSFVDELKIDQSVAHNGVCLTVVRKDRDTFTTTAMRETLERSNLGLLNQVAREFGTQYDDERTSGRTYRAGACRPDCRLYKCGRCKWKADLIAVRYPFDPRDGAAGIYNCRERFRLCQWCEPDCL